MATSAAPDEVSRTLSSYRRLPFPHPSTGSGDSATYLANWDGAGHAAMLVSHGRFTSGPTVFVQSSCSG